MNDPFANGPLVFRPRANAKAINVGAIVFFVTFILLGWAPVVFSDRGKAFFVGFALFATATFGALMTLFVAALRETRESIVLDAKGVQANGRRLAWEAVESAEEEMRSDKVVVVRASGQPPLVLRITHYEDGGEMGRLVRSQVRPKPWTEAERVYRPKGRVAATLVSVFYLAASVALAFAQRHVPMPPRALVHPMWIPLIPMPFLLLGLIDSLTRAIRLTPSSLIVGSLLVRRSFALSKVEEVRETDSGLSIRAGGRSFRFRKSYEGFAELRDRLIGLVPKKGPDAVPVVSKESVGYLPSRWGWAGPLFMGLFILSFGLPGVVMGLAMVGEKLGAGLTLAGVCLIPTLLGFCALAYAIEARTSYVLDEDGIERKAFYKPRRLRWSDIEGAWRTGSTLSGMHLKTATDSLSVAPDFVQDGEALIAAINARVSEAKDRAVRKSEGEEFGAGSDWVFMSGFLGLIGLLMLGGSVPAFNGSMNKGRAGDEVASVILGCLFAGMGLLLIGLAVSSYFSRFVPRAEGLEVVTIRGRRLVPWGEITRAESAIQRGKSTRVSLTLEHPQGPVKINTTMTRDFDRLRGAILAHLDPGIVRSEEG